jgi:TPR repeat protein
MVSFRRYCSAFLLFAFAHTSATDVRAQTIPPPGSVDRDIAVCTNETARPAYQIPPRNLPAAAALARWGADHTAWLFDDDAALLQLTKAATRRAELEAAAPDDIVARTLLALLDLDGQTERSVAALESIAEAGDAGVSMRVYRARMRSAGASSSDVALLPELERAMRNGHPSAATFLSAALLEAGAPDARSRVEAVTQAGAQSGDPSSMGFHAITLIARAEKSGASAEEGLAMLRRAAELGNLPARVDLARLRRHSTVVPQSDRAALACARAVADSEPLSTNPRASVFTAHEIVADILLRQPQWRRPGVTEGVDALEAMGKAAITERLASRVGAPSGEDLARWGLTLEIWFDPNPQQLFTAADGHFRVAELKARQTADPVSAYLYAASWMFDAHPDKRDYRGGVRLLEALAENGNAAAMYHLYALDLLEPGRFTPRGAGAKWLQRLRADGDPRLLNKAMLELGPTLHDTPADDVFLTSHGDTVRAAMDAGSSIGLLFAARASARGIGGFSQSPAQAQILLIAAGERGLPSAWITLADCAATGSLGERSPALSAHWYRRAIRIASGAEEQLATLTQALDKQVAAARTWPAQPSPP